MPAIEHLMKRMGFVRLSRYGLLLTPEGRIMSMRPDILDDGMGGRIVGWPDRDLAATELQKWEPARPAPQKAVAGPVATPVRVFVVPVAARVIAPLSPPPIPVRAAVVAIAPEPEEDEWEWTIALAHARAAADEVAAATIPARPTRRMRLDTVPPPPVFIEAKTDVGSPPKFVEAKTLPMATIALAREPVIDSDQWPKTEPLGNIDYEDYTSPAVRIVRMAQPTMIPARAPKATPAPMIAIPQQPLRTMPRAQSPSTVIPIPRLPRAAASSFEPVVRTRFPKATPTGSLGISPPPPVRPAEEERTSPGFALPPIAHVVSLPRIPSLAKR